MFAHDSNTSRIAFAKGDNPIFARTKIGTVPVTRRQMLKMRPGALSPPPGRCFHAARAPSPPPTPKAKSN